MPVLPTGTVTFIVTDIEGSTALWERDRGAMATAVERHIALLDAAIQGHGGVLFKTVVMRCRLRLRRCRLIPFGDTAAPRSDLRQRGHREDRHER